MELPIVETGNRRQNYTKQGDELKDKEMVDCLYLMYNPREELIYILVVEFFAKEEYLRMC